MDTVENALHRLLRAVQTAGTATDRALAAQTVVTAISQQGALRNQVIAARREAVNELRAAGLSLAAIAEILGVARGTVQLISEGKSTGRVVIPRRR